jgi:hypothetical protein
MQGYPGSRAASPHAIPDKRFALSGMTKTEIEKEPAGYPAPLLAAQYAVRAGFQNS